VVLCRYLAMKGARSPKAVPTAAGEEGVRAEGW
jgi:hypothetical protein